MLKQEFAGRILPFDSQAAQAYASLSASRRDAGRPISVFDAQIAAITLVYEATLATRNVRDFRRLKLLLVNPRVETLTVSQNAKSPAREIRTGGIVFPKKDP